MCNCYLMYNKGIGWESKNIEKNYCVVVRMCVCVGNSSCLRGKVLEKVHVYFLVDTSCLLLVHINYIFIIIFICASVSLIGFPSNLKLIFLIHQLLTIGFH